MIKPNGEEEEKVRGGEKLALVLYTKSSNSANSNNKKKTRSFAPLGPA